MRFLVHNRSGGNVSHKAAYRTLTIQPESRRNILGLSFQAYEGTKYSAKVQGGLRKRGVQQSLITDMDGRTRPTRAIEATFSQAQIKPALCIYLRHSMSFASHTSLNTVAAALMPLRAATSPAMIPWPSWSSS